jgi:hypothetical protein
MPLAGCVVCVSMDPLWGYLEPFCRGLFECLEKFAATPAAFLTSIGSFYTAIGQDGCTFGWPPDSYIADMHEPESKVEPTQRDDDSRQGTLW